MSIIAETISKTSETPSSKITGESKDHGKNILLSGNLLIINNRVDVPMGSGQGFDRGKITKFSESSGRRMRRYLRECLPDYRNMVTLTYPCGYGRDGKQSKLHLKKFIQECKRYSERHKESNVDLWSIFWFMEFQQNGAIHYHMFTTNDYPKEWIARTWYRIVDSEDERHLRAGTRIERLRAGRSGTISYAGKYACKSEQKIIPEELQNCGRFWGVSGCRVTVSASTFVNSENMQNRRVLRSLNRLKDVLKGALIRKHVVKLNTTRDNVTIYVVNESKTRQEISTCIWFLANNVQLMNHDPGSEYFKMNPELKEDIALCQ